MTEQFRKADKLMVDGGGLAMVYAPSIIDVDGTLLTVVQARALRGWLNRTLPEDGT